MKVLHVIPSLSPTQGGPSFALPIMERALAGTEVAVTVVTTDDDGPGRRASVPLGQPVVANGAKRLYFRKQLEFYKVSLPLARWLDQNVGDFDLVHIHALFSFASTVAARAARKHGIPYVVRPLGVLNRWGMENRRRGLKALSFRFVETPLLRHAAAMHYTSEAEKLEAEETGATAPGAVIPLGIDTAAWQNMPGPATFLEEFPAARGRRLILFLSRLDGKKGLDLLLPAFAEIWRRHPDTMLVLAGEGAADFTSRLRESADTLGVGREILWPGFLTGAMKMSVLSAATVFVLPSYSENFGIALVEALAAGLPCVTTTGVAVSAEVAAFQAGLVVPPERVPLTKALDQLLSDAPLRAYLGGNARRLAQDRFSLEALGGALRQFYAQMITRQKRP